MSSSPYPTASSARPVSAACLRMGPRRAPLRGAAQDPARLSVPCASSSLPGLGTPPLPREALCGRPRRRHRFLSSISTLITLAIFFFLEIN